MKWAEMIRVRSSAEGVAGLYDGLPRVISGLREETEILDAFLLIHALDVGDLAVILLWRGTTGRPGKSAEGSILARNFEEYGTVEHSIWMIASEELNRNSLFPGRQNRGEIE